METLAQAIQTTPIIDHHAHNLLLPDEIDAHDLLSITSEAQGPTLQQGAPSTLAHLRAVHQLAKVLDCVPNWDAVQTEIKLKRKELNDAWSRQCFQGLETVLIDDGLDPSNVHPYQWHDRLVPSKCKRIVRIERIAEAIMVKLFDEEFIGLTPNQQRQIPIEVERRFTIAIENALSDPEVVGFKSVICYRVGLAIPAFDADARIAIYDILQSKDKERCSRLEDDRLSPFFVHLTALAIERSNNKKPFQFHTGLGDNDIDLESSNPSHLQRFIEAYPEVPIVLLHASYPFTKEAGYLASVFGNVWLDIGEIFPFLSQDGQERAIREALDLCPSEKLMWSTDGHWFPETYLLATMQVREAMNEVLRGYVDRGALTEPEAIKIVKDVFFNTSNRLYELELSLTPITLTGLHEVSERTSPEEQWATNFALLTHFLDDQPYVQYLRLQWMDYTATLRLRVFPIKQALKFFSAKKLTTITKAVFGLLQDDSVCPGFSATGVYNLYPCFDSLRLGFRGGFATLQCDFQEENGAEVPICPRTVLRKQAKRAKQLGLDLLVGFEVEVVIISSDIVDGEFQYGARPINHGGHAWSTARAMHHNSCTETLEEIHYGLDRAGIELEQYHPESSPGQYEFVLGALPPLKAVDTLVAAREIIANSAARDTTHATLHPKPFPDHCGTGAHVHISLGNNERWKPFYAGILKHLRAISAFTYSNEASYERVVDGVWAGSTWITWGTQNRETPLRRISGSHFEIKCMDGLANPYLALAALIGAGLQGVIDKEPLLLQDCLSDPSKLTEKERRELGITKQFPKSIEEALDCLGGSKVMRGVLGKEVVDAYVGVKQMENAMLEKMEPGRRRNWLIERY